MIDERKQEKSRTELSTGNLVGVLLGLGFGFGLLGFGLGTVGRNLIGGDVGEWVGMGVVFAIVCVACWTIHRTLVHPHLSVICVLLVCLSASKVGEEIGKDVEGEFAPKWGGTISFLVTAATLITLGKAGEYSSEPDSAD